MNAALIDINLWRQIASITSDIFDVSLTVRKVPLMRIMSNWLIYCALFLLAWVMFPPSAHAYIDPGTGSYILQIVIAGIAAGVFAIKMFWGKIKALFSGNRAQNQSDKDFDE
jgi:hypothetical protein